MIESPTVRLVFHQVQRLLASELLINPMTAWVDCGDGSCTQSDKLNRAAGVHDDTSHASMVDDHSVPSSQPLDDMDDSVDG